MSGIKDETTKIELKQMSFNKKIKGHTKIELTSVVDGSRQVIEHNNVFQQGVLANYMRSLGKINNNPYRNSSWSELALWQNLVGGIFLFRDSIDNSNGEVEYMPAGNLMVANGSYNLVNNGSPSELGSYNSLESVVGNNGITIVYDWGTSQGNGTIGCICLTSRVGGRIGYGNASDGYYSSATNFDQDQTYDFDGGIRHNEYKYYFRVENSNHVLKVIKERDNTITQSILGDSLKEIIEIDYGVQISGRTTPLASGDKTSYVSILDATHVLIQNPGASPSIYVQNGNSYSVLIYDLENDTAIVKSYLNNSGSSIYPITSDYKTFRVHQNRVFVNDVTSNNNILVLDATTGTLIKTINFGFKSNKVSCGLLSEGLVIIPRYTGTGNNSNYCYIYDTTTDTYRRINANASSILPEYSYYLDAIGNARAIWSGTWQSTYANCTFAVGCKNPLYLSTINNLDAPVTKNNTQTMKVTYTLTEVQE